MDELNILYPFSLDKFFLTRQLILKSKIEKHNVSSDSFVSETRIVEPETFIYLGK